MESPKNNSVSHSDFWHKMANFLMIIVVGFLGGALAVRMYDQNLLNPENSTQIVLNESEVIADIAQRVGPSVVSISVETRALGGFFNNQVYTQESAGTGIIVSSDGLVLTNRHVIGGDTSQLTIILSDGTVYDDVKVIDKDLFNDIAFLKINDVKDLPAAVMGDSDKSRVGDKVIAIGNALGQYENTVTSGIISGIGRPVVAGDGFDSESLTNLFQTDAAINPGNSGGPLMNIKGEIIGINTAVAGGGAENIGFAIPINDVKPILQSVIESGQIIRPYIGLRYVMLTPQIASQLNLAIDEGAYIVSGDNSAPAAIITNSPAAKADLQEGDIIVKINGTAVSRDNPLASQIGRHQVGDTLVLNINRDGTQLIKEVVLEAAPDSF
jgi:S1-C subfamily serine protease